MNAFDENDDQRLRALLHDAVSDVDPRDRLGEVRRRTLGGRTRSRRWTPVVLGAGAVAATVLVAAVVVGTFGDDDQASPPVAGSPTGPTDGDPITSAAGIYYVSDTTTGPRLFREFQAVTPTADPAERVLVALRRLSADLGPIDPDYRTLWPTDAFAAVEVEDDRVVVELGTEAALAPPGADGEGRYGVQQAVFTAEAALGDDRPVAFEWDGKPARWVLGTRVGALVQRDRSSGLTAPVNISDPGENLAIEGGSFTANGTMSDTAGPVHWYLGPADEQGGADEQAGVFLQGTASPVEPSGTDARVTLGAPAWDTGPIDLSDVPPGRYLFGVTTRDVGQTSDRRPLFTDTRIITVR